MPTTPCTYTNLQWQMSTKVRPLSSRFIHAQYEQLKEGSRPNITILKTASNMINLSGRTRRRQDSGFRKRYKIPGALKKYAQTQFYHEASRLHHHHTPSCCVCCVLESSCQPRGAQSRQGPSAVQSLQSRQSCHHRMLHIYIHWYGLWRLFDLIVRGNPVWRRSAGNRGISSVRPLEEGRQNYCKCGLLSARDVLCLLVSVKFYIIIKDFLTFTV